MSAISSPLPTSSSAAFSSDSSSSLEVPSVSLFPSASEEEDTEGGTVSAKEEDGFGFVGLGDCISTGGAFCSELESIFGED